MLLKKGMRGEDVKVLQHLLGNRGYFNGVVDGIFGEETERAVKAFQLSNGLGVDGIVGEATNKALSKDPSGFTEYLLRRGDKGEGVKRLQRALISAGYNVGSSGADGDFGKGTEYAVKSFQKDNRLDVDGIVGPNTWKALSDPVEGRGSQRLLKLGSTGNDVKILQHLLNNRGYDCGVADGIFGEGTERAVKAFQRANRLDVDGIVGEATNKALSKDPSSFTKYTLRNGDSGENVKRLQRALLEAGYNIGSSGVDGYFGSGTERAVKKFQADNGLDDDGIVGPKTWDMLDNIGSSKQITRLLRYGSTGWDVKILQQLLNNRGYNCGIADGIFGAGTEKAVKAFQRANGLEVDGIVGEATNKALSRDPSGFTRYTLRKGDKGEAVRQLQQILVNAGYSVGAGIDGDFGVGTESAVKKFQRDNRLEADGIVGPNTWKALEGVKGSGTYSGLLKLGSRGRGVVILQELLIDKGYNIGVYGADGEFGKATENAVKAFQKANGLNVDGIVGPNTWEALQGGFDNQYVGGKGVEKFLNVAISQLGYHEQGVNITKYGAWYGDNGEEWCAMFVSWCANRAGILYSVVPKYEGCEAGADWYRRMNRYGRRGKYTPKPGDVIFFYDESKSAPYYHTGIVEYVEGNTVHTIEGNASDAVRRESYSLSNWRIHGYGNNGGIKHNYTQKEIGEAISKVGFAKLLGVSFSKDINEVHLTRGPMKITLKTGYSATIGKADGKITISNGDVGVELSNGSSSLNVESVKDAIKRMKKNGIDISNIGKIVGNSIKYSINLGAPISINLEIETKILGDSLTVIQGIEVELNDNYDEKDFHSDSEIELFGLISSLIMGAPQLGSVVVDFLGSLVGSIPEIVRSVIIFIVSLGLI